MSGRPYRRPVETSETRTVPEQEFEQLVRFLKVLADKNRLRILGLLAEREYSVKELAAELGVKEPTVSSHLNMMKWHDMVNMRQEGTTHYYSLRQDDIHHLLQQLRPKAFPDTEEIADASEFERRVLQSFFEEGRLKQIPMARNKMLVVLRHLLREFESGQQYPEQQVNEILKRYHPDYATLRRQMIENGLMAREKGIYWRLV
jgi:DNA-binding HxlR family transcriptional regulator